MRAAPAGPYGVADGGAILFKYGFRPDVLEADRTPTLPITGVPKLGDAAVATGGALEPRVANDGNAPLAVDIVDVVGVAGFATLEPLGTPGAVPTAAPRPPKTPAGKLPFGLGLEDPLRLADISGVAIVGCGDMCNTAERVV